MQTEEGADEMVKAGGVRVQNVIKKGEDSRAKTLRVSCNQVIQIHFGVVRKELFWILFSFIVFCSFPFSSIEKVKAVYYF